MVANPQVKANPSFFPNNVTPVAPQPKVVFFLGRDQGHSTGAGRQRQGEVLPLPPCMGQSLRGAAGGHRGSGSSSPLLGVCKGGKQGISHPRDTPRTGAGQILSEAWGAVSSQGSRGGSGFGGSVGGFLAIPAGAAETQQRGLSTAIDSALIKSKVSALSPGQPGPLLRRVLPATPFQHVTETFPCPRFTHSTGAVSSTHASRPRQSLPLGIRNHS